MSERLKTADEESAYARAAHVADQVVAGAIDASLLAFPEEREAIIAGSTGALVRAVVAGISERGTPATVREVLGVLLPSINKIAEQVVAGTREVRIPEA